MINYGQGDKFVVIRVSSKELLELRGWGGVIDIIPEKNYENDGDEWICIAW